MMEYAIRFFGFGHNCSRFTIDSMINEVARQSGIPACFIDYERNGNMVDQLCVFDARDGRYVAIVDRFDCSL